MTGAPELGTEIAGYRLESVLGEGGMGTVYLARGPEGGICALKVLSAQLSEDPSFTTRFKREAQYAEALDHPHIVELYDAGETPDGILYFAMQYVDGPDLGVLLRRDGRFDLTEALSILGQIGDALDCAHATGLVHRDVKPGNIIVADDPGGPQAYLADFGLSKNRSQDSVALTKMGQLLGTVSYAAPEAIMATEPRDHRVDIYSLGCVLYESIVGAPPFAGDQEIGVLYAHIGNPRPSATASRPDLPTGIDDVIAKAMAISAEERYSSCAELIAAARSLLPVEVESPEAEGMGAAPAVPAAVAEAAEAATPVSAQPGSVEDGAPPGVLTLVVLSGFGHGLTLTVEDELVLGRQMTLEGALAPDHSISRRHARITRTGDGAFAVEDEHSRNGTYVNGARIDAPQTLRTGDELRIGATAFAVTVPDPDAETATDGPSEWIEAPHGENAAGAPAEWIEATPAENAADAPAEWIESTPAENPAHAPAGWLESPADAPAESVEAIRAENAPDAEVEAAQAESAAEAPAEAVEAPRELGVEARKPGGRLALRLELDVEAGELIVAIENGATVRLVRQGDEWYVESD